VLLQTIGSDELVMLVVDRNPRMLFMLISTIMECNVPEKLILSDKPIPSSPQALKGWTKVCPFFMHTSEHSKIYNYICFAKQ